MGKTKIVKASRKGWNVIFNCDYCGKKVVERKSHYKRTKAHFCSMKCYGKSKRGKKLTEEHKAKIRASGKRNEENNMWKGDNASYVAKHIWIRVRKGKPNYCEHCKTAGKRKYEWANVSGEYKRDVNDFIRLCVPCHKKYDNEKKVPFSINCVICEKEVFTISKKRKYCSRKCNLIYLYGT